MKEASAAQVRASNPSRSSWVSANAGSGKTRVLTDRVARLLLAGTDPQRILCLTYTKAAAAEMQNRLFRTLGCWAMLDDAKLREALGTLGEPADDLPDASLSRARTLFARALETPGGLKIQTIHAFCEALLRRFPLEAGVPPQFEVLDERQAAALREEVRDTVAQRHAATFLAVAHIFSRPDPDSLIREIAQHRAAFAGPFDADALGTALGVPPGETLEALAAELLDPRTEALLVALIPALRTGGKTDCTAAERLTEARTAADPRHRLRAVETALLTQKGHIPKHFPTKSVQSAFPSMMLAVTELVARTEAFRRRRLALDAFERSVAINRFGRVWLAAWNERKRELGRLDFDDMIDRTRDLLARPGTAAWVLWRLDGGLDHILVDEAQDTGPAQWEVISAISDEFFAGAGARTLKRTIFVVGDEKQSIYSFQGADPASFGAKRSDYADALTEIGEELQRCDLLYSFRSARPILRLVDRVFGGVAGSDLDGTIAHFATDADRPGRIELWPFPARPERPTPPPWYEPRAAELPADPVRDLAERIAGEVAGWLRDNRLLPGEDPPRPIRAGDVMILVQRRSPIFHAVILALKRAGVPVAGADLLRVGSELAVKDMVAALRFAATPSDDLSLATVLRSPLGGVSERELFELAHGRSGSLWQALRAAPPERWPAVRALLADLMAQADFLRPHELLARILIRHDGRRRLIARLGAEAEDGIDALIDLALAYEQVEAPSLTGFIAWFDRHDIEVKRRSGEDADHVQVMTVHGAKGLERPIVILPDTGTRHKSQHAPQILRLADGTPVARVPKSGAPPALVQANGLREDLVQAENRRLLYVALTRAKTWLIVCGAGVEPGETGESWHALVEEALVGLGAVVESDPHGDIRVLSQDWPQVATTAGRSPSAPPPPLPLWATTRTARPPEPLRYLSPSALGGETALPGETAGPLSEAEAMARGTAIHLLLEHLPGVPLDTRAEAAARLLPVTADVPDLVAEACAVLDDPELAALFGPESLSEVDVAAPLGTADGARIIGRIDRLLVSPQRIFAVDFKSNRTVPDCAEAVPEGLLRQLGAYRAALAAIWPDRPVATAILWTRTRRLMPLPDALVDDAFAARPQLDPREGRS